MIVYLFNLDKLFPPPLLSTPQLNSTMNIVLQKERILNDKFDIENEINQRHLTKEDILDYRELSKILESPPLPRYENLIPIESREPPSYYIPKKQVDPNV